MGNVGARIGLFTLSVALIGCSDGTRDAVVAPTVRPDFVLTFDGPARNCHVALSGTGKENALPCSKVVGFLREAPGISTASRFEVKLVPDVNEADHDAVMVSLAAAGYRLTPGPHVGFLTEPKGANDR
jgi:hypothetical protein